MFAAFAADTDLHRSLSGSEIFHRFASTAVFRLDRRLGSSRPLLHLAGADGRVYVRPTEVYHGKRRGPSQDDRSTKGDAILTKDDDVWYANLLGFHLP